MAAGNRRWRKRDSADEVAITAERPMKDAEISGRLAVADEAPMPAGYEHQWLRQDTSSANSSLNTGAEGSAAALCDDAFSVLLADDMHELMPGFVHLRGVLSPEQQQALLDVACEVAGRARFTRSQSGGWYRKLEAPGAGCPGSSSPTDSVSVPGTSSPSAKAQTQEERCDWQLNDGTKARFWDQIESAFPCPSTFRKLGATIAGLAAQRFPAELVAATQDYHPRVGALNFYSSKGRMNWHVDDYNFAKKERPIVMACLGHAADFGYKLPYDKSAAERRVRLESGDAIVFGGAARDMPHALLQVHPATCPGDLRFPHPPGSGRVSITWRDVGEEDGLVFNSDERLGLVDSEHSLGRYRRGGGKSHAQLGGRKGKGNGKSAGKDALQNPRGKGRFAPRTK